MIDRRALLRDLQGQVKALEKDLRAQVADVEEVYSRLRSEYDRAFDLHRTAATWAVWRDERVTQAAVAWVLGTVFVRFCEDNGLLGNACFLAGPTTDRAVLAEESQEEYFRRYKERTDRDWVLAAFEHIGQSQAGRLLFDKRHNAAYHIPLSHDGAKALIAFWRRRDESGTLVHDFTDAEWGTRFLGDLYQELSEAARKTYALLQTPEFVEEFILDLTLTPAIEGFGYDVVKVIDPTCGSGHFLLEAFRRLVEQWREHTSRDSQEIARLALEAVHGVDINPYAVAIARFRLLLAAMRAAEFKTLEEIRGYEFPLRIAIGDSLIKHRQRTLFDDVDHLADFRYATEDLDDFPGILGTGEYHVVVGNPPYVTPKDKGLNELYRETYKDVCSGKYALSVPFAQRFFELARRPGSDGRGSGYVGQITANSFMKREFGRKLIEKFFANEVDLTHVIDTSGAYIPGHGTPTVILVGRARKTNRAGTIRTVMGIRGEPSAPEVPAEGYVWRAIVSQVRSPGSESAWISVTDSPRDHLARFPWSLSGGGAASLADEIRYGGVVQLGAVSNSLGITSFTLADDIYIQPASTLRRARVPDRFVRPIVQGDGVRDWSVDLPDQILFPYRSDFEAVVVEEWSGLLQFMWPTRALLSNSRMFGDKTKVQAGLRWSEYGRLTKSKLRVAQSIVWASVATHNHFFFDRGEKIFNRHAPVIKLRGDATEDDHLQLLGVLNSSTACFWLKQVSHDKGIRGEGGGFTSDDWERFYEFTGTKLQEFPLPKAYPLELARQLDAAAQRLSAVSPAAVAAGGVPTRERLAAAKAEWESTRGRMIALQEELDWQVYTQYGLLSEELTAPADAVPELRFGERAFEIVLARKDDVDTQWFVRHGAEPIDKLPEEWPAEYRTVVEKRIAVIESNRYLALIERPECKRRWSTDGWDGMQQRALRDWLLDRCETRELWYAPDENGSLQPRPMSTNQLTDELRRDPDVLTVVDLYAPGLDLADVVAELIDTQHVPYLAALRYTTAGLSKRADWETVWEMQRAEDAAPDEPAKRRIRDRIPVPPKYAPADFRQSSYWRDRGKLDVPKERFVSYPHAGHDRDQSLLVGWAGWDHREQAQVLAVLVVEREQQDGWSADRLTPLLAGLREVMPWVRQWHAEFDPIIGDSPVDIYDGFLAERVNFWHLTDSDLVGWRPRAATRSRQAP